MWQRRGLVLVVYVVGLLFAVLIGAGLVRLLDTEIGSTGFSQDLVRGFDPVLWFDFFDGLKAGLAALMRQAALTALIMMVWKVASSVGLIHALNGDATGSFWEGVRQYTVRGFGLALLYFIPLVVLVGIVIGIGSSVTSDMGEVGVVWMWMAVIPLACIVLIAIFDLFHDYARMHLVLRGATIRRAWLRGIQWPFRHFRSAFLYKLWFLISALLWVAVLIVGFYMPDHSVAAVFLAFLIQQILIIARNGATVAWIGAETALFERFAPPVEEADSADSADSAGSAGSAHSADSVDSAGSAD